MNKFIKQAFTLIELLVVIAIIGILSGLIVVSMNGVTSKATIAKGQIFSNSLKNSLMLNLVSEWKFDQVNIPSTNQTPDSWSGGNTGTLNGTGGTQNLPQLQTTGCVSGNCLSFDGTDDYVDVLDSTNLNLTNEITIGAWIKRTGKLNDTDIIVSKDNVGNKRQYSLYIDPGNYIFFIIFKNTTSYKSISSSSAYSSINDWYYIVTTYKYITDGTSIMDIYINGAKNATQITNAVGPIMTTDEHLRIGDDGYTLANRTFQGLVDDVRIYNVTIPTSQIQEQYYAGLNKLLANKGITQEEYLSRINSLAIKN